MSIWTKKTVFLCKKTEKSLFEGHFKVTKGSDQNLVGKNEFLVKFWLRINYVTSVFQLKPEKNYQKSLLNKNFQIITVTSHVTELSQFDRTHHFFSSVSPNFRLVSNTIRHLVYGRHTAGMKSAFFRTLRGHFGVKSGSDRDETQIFGIYVKN